MARDFVAAVLSMVAQDVAGEAEGAADHDAGRGGARPALPASGVAQHVAGDGP